MAQVNQDIALSGNDLAIYQGDLTVCQSDVQHITDTLNAFPGWWKENPADGVGIFQYLNAPGAVQDLKRAIRLQLTADQYQVGNPSVTIDPDGTLTVNPDATR